MNRDTLKKARAAGAAAGGADAAQIDLRRNKIQQRGEKALQGAQMRKPGAMVIWRDDQIIPESAQDGGDDSDSETEFAPIPVRTPPAPLGLVLTGGAGRGLDPARSGAAAGGRACAAAGRRPQHRHLHRRHRCAGPLCIRACWLTAAADSYVQLLQQATGQFRRDAQQDDLPLVMVSLLADIPKLVAFMLEAPVPAPPLQSCRPLTVRRSLLSRRPARPRSACGLASGARGRRCCWCSVPSCASTRSTPRWPWPPCSTSSCVAAWRGRGWPVLTAAVQRAFFAFPFNNILHALAPRLLAPILSGESPILAEAVRILPHSLSLAGGSDGGAADEGRHPGPADRRGREEPRRPVRAPAPCSPVRG
jgi:hypothetical protein